jgi:hypothetical protein
MIHNLFVGRCRLELDGLITAASSEKENQAQIAGGHDRGQYRNDPERLGLGRVLGLGDALLEFGTGENRRFLFSIQRLVFSKKGESRVSP